MKTIFIILIIIGSLILIGILIKILTRNRNDDNDSSGIFNRASSVSRKFSDCCKKIGKFFGGGA